MSGNGLRVGVLALQGDFEAHRRAIEGRGVPTAEVRVASDLDGLRGIVLPGGESTTVLNLLEGSTLAGRLGELIRGGLPVLATCAGVILLAREVHHPVQRSLGLLDVVVDRNAYGRQIDSAVVELAVCDREAIGGNTLEGVFIRAPRVTEVGASVEVLARRGDDPVLLRQGHLLAATFHPELSPGSPVTDLFVRTVRKGP